MPVNPVIADKTVAVSKPAEKSQTPVHIVLPEEPPKEENERHARKNVVPRHNISIRDAISGKINPPEEPVKASDIDIEQITEDDIAVGNEQDFDQEMLEEKWKVFAGTLQIERPRMAIALKSKLPVLQPGYQVEVILDNSTQQEDFVTNIKAHLQVFLRKELLNESIKVSVRMEENIDDGKKKMYTTEEKLQYLSNKNPAVTRLKQQFNMELE
jgi:DNA polymerase-3 subunit gamma/tau